MSTSPEELADARGEIVGSSPETVALRSLIRKLRSHSGPLLVRGESGTNRAAVAKAIHQASDRADGPFAELDVTTLDREVAEKALVGVAPELPDTTGSGAGLLQQCSGGSIYIRGIHNLGTNVQEQLLNAIRSGETRPVGSTVSKTVDTRIITSTDHDLLADVRSFRFSKPLYYVLSLIRIEIPPLRQRRADIAELMNHFLKRFSTIPRSLSSEAATILTAYDWPGNEEELMAVARYVSAVNDTEFVDSVSLPDTLKDGSRGEESKTFLPLSEVERQHILAAVDWARGDLNAAAHILGIGRTTLYRKLRAYKGG